MKWPFVRISKYELLEDELNIIKKGYSKILEHNRHLSDENDLLCKDNNNLNQELASELNSHRETKEALEAYKKALAERSEEYEKLLNKFRKTSTMFKEVKNEIIISLKKLY